MIMVNCNLQFDTFMHRGLSPLHACDITHFNFANLLQIYQMLSSLEHGI